MKCFPAIDLIDGCAVRLVRGDYNMKTVYSEEPEEVAEFFRECGAEYVHVVDLEGARDGGTPNIDTIKRIIEQSGLNVEVGGGIRSEEVIEKYINAGVFRVILGTAALADPEFLKSSVEKYGEKIAVGVDIKDGMVAIKGWTEVSEISCFDFCEKLEKTGVQTVICTDISKDGLLSGTNIELYRELSERFSFDIVASGGVTTMDDILKIKEMGLYGVIIGKAVYNGNIDLKEAVYITGEA